MMTNSSGPHGTLIARVRRRLSSPMASVALLAALGAVGCSSSSSSDLDEYTGTWSIDPMTSTFTLTCPDTVIDGGTAPFRLWSVVTLQEGTLSDLTEVGGPCAAYYDITSLGTATMATPDPFTGEAPSCLLEATTDGSLFLNFEFTNWKITLQTPVKGKPPHGQMIGAANAPLFGVDADGALVPDERGDCSYVVRADLIKIAKD